MINDEFTSIIKKQKIFYHIVDGKFRGWLYSDLNYGFELTKFNGAFEVTTEEYERIEKDRINKRGMIVGFDGGLKVLEVPEFYVTPKYSLERDLIVDIATQKEFLETKKEIQIEMREIYKNIEISKTLNISYSDEEIKLQELINKLEYIQSKILIKL